LKKQFHNAERENKKIAMFHYQILIHADELKGMTLSNFVRKSKFPYLYATELEKC